MKLLKKESNKYRQYLKIHKIIYNIYKKYNSKVMIMTLTMSSSINTPVSSALCVVLINRIYYGVQGKPETNIYFLTSNVNKNCFTLRLR